MKEMIYYPNGKDFGVELGLEVRADGMYMYGHLDYLKLKPPYKMLTVGCGKGIVVEYFREKGAEAYGIDIRNVFPQTSHILPLMTPVKCSFRMKLLM